MRLFIHQLFPTNTKDASIGPTRCLSPVLIAAANLDSAQAVAWRRVFLQMREFADSHEEAEQMVTDAMLNNRSQVTELPCKVQFMRGGDDPPFGQHAVVISADGGKSLLISPFEFGVPS